MFTSKTLAILVAATAFIQVLDLVQGAPLGKHPYEPVLKPGFAVKKLAEPLFKKLLVPGAPLNYKPGSKAVSSPVYHKRIPRDASIFEKFSPKKIADDLADAFANFFEFMTAAFASRGDGSRNTLTDLIAGGGDRANSLSALIGGGENISGALTGLMGGEKNDDKSSSRTEEEEGTGSGKPRGVGRLRQQLSDVIPSKLLGGVL